MLLEQMSNGRRVRIAREMELYPIGKFEPGLTGTVELINSDGETEPYCLVLLDATVAAPGVNEHPGMHSNSSSDAPTSISASG